MNGRNKAFLAWSILNLLWWVASIYNGYFRVPGVDLNPFLGDTREIILNGIVFLIGLLIINGVVQEEEEPEEEDDDE